MIIPIKCFTCGCVLADKYRLYLNKVLFLFKMNDLIFVARQAPFAKMPKTDSNQ